MCVCVCVCDAHLHERLVGVCACAFGCCVVLCCVGYKTLGAGVDK